jgi:hypothetical protein
MGNTASHAKTAFHPNPVCISAAYRYMPAVWDRRQLHFGPKSTFPEMVSTFMKIIYSKPQGTELGLHIKREAFPKEGFVLDGSGCSA